MSIYTMMKIVPQLSSILIGGRVNKKSLNTILSIHTHTHNTHCVWFSIAINKFPFGRFVPVYTREKKYRPQSIHN